MDWARVMRGISSIANEVTPAEARRWMVSVRIEESDDYGSRLEGGSLFGAQGADLEHSIGLAPGAGASGDESGAGLLVARIGEVGTSSCTSLDQHLEPFLDEFPDGLGGGCNTSFSRASLFGNEYFSHNFRG